MVFNVDKSALFTAIILILYYYFLNLKNNDIESTLSCWWWECKVIGQMLQNMIFGRETSCQLCDTRRKIHNASTFWLHVKNWELFKNSSNISNKSNLLFCMHNCFIYVTNCSDQMGGVKRFKNVRSNGYYVSPFVKHNHLLL